MRILASVAFVLIAGGSLLAQSGTESAASNSSAGDSELIQKLLNKINALERRVIELEEPAKPELSEAPAEGTQGLEESLDEVVHHSPVNPAAKPTRLNFTAPGLQGVDVYGRGLWRYEKWLGFNSPTIDTLLAQGDPNNINKDNINSFGQRINVGFNFRVTEKTTVTAEIEDARIWGTDSKGPGTISVNNDGFQLSQGFLQSANLYNSGIDLKLGRQIIELGSERQIGNDDWLLRTWSFDAIRLDRQFGGAGEASLIFAREQETDQIDRNEFTPGAATRGNDSLNDDLYTLYWTHQSESIGALDAYLIFLDADDENNTIDVDTRLWTYGVRSEHTIGPVFWDLEAAHQHGRINGVRTDFDLKDNWGLFSRVGVAMGDETPFFRRAYFGFDYASGDSDGTGGSAGDANEADGFVQIMPSLHGWFGIMDLVSWQNIHHWVLGMDFDAMGHGNLGLSWHVLRMDSDDDDVIGYNSGIDGGASITSKAIGQELDIVYDVRPTEHTSIGLGFGHFFPSHAYTQMTGSHGSITFGYAQFGVDF
jgi:hypothetical protein